MEFLRKSTILLGTSLALLSTSSFAAIEGLVLRSGLDAEVVYDGSAGEFQIGLPSQLALDPQTGDLYFGNSVQGQDSYIMIVNPETGAASKFPFFGNGIAFNSDGSTLYFGLANLMLGVWNRDTDEYRKFTILPGVEAVQVVDDGSEKGKLLVANSDYGKNILGVDAVWEVDQGDGYYQTVMQFNEGSIDVGVNFAALDAMAVDGSGNIYTLTGQGKVLVRMSDGSYEEGNTAPVTISGLMQGGLGASPDGMVYYLDTGSGEVFGYFPDGSQVMVAYGAPLGASINTDGGIISDGNSIYLINDKKQIIRIFAAGGQALNTLLASNLGTSTINGVINDPDGLPLSGVEVSLRDKSILSTFTNASGEFSFTVASGLYHVKAELANYGDFNAPVVSNANTSTDLAIGLASFLPGYLPPGLEADIIATKSADSISGSSDVTFDVEGNLYSLNHSNGTITKTIFDPETAEVLQTFVAAKGGGISNAWAVAVGDDLNMYSSSSNSGLMRLPPADPDNLIDLVVDPDDEGIVRDQNGIDRMVSYVTDIDGIAKMSNGDMMLTSGSGGSIIDGFPEGTVDTLIRYNPTTGAQTLFSRGYPAGSTSSVFFNPDVLKSDANDLLYVTNKAGNVVRVDTSGVATLIWPGDATGTTYPEGLSSYTAFNADPQGNMYLKGADTLGTPVLRMIDPADDHNILVVASELSPSSAFGGFEFTDGGRSVVLSEWNFLLRIRATDGRTITENIVSPPTGATATIRKGASLFANPDSKAYAIKEKPHHEIEDFTVIDPATVKLPALWFNETKAESPAETSSSGGGAMSWLLVCGLFFLKRKKVKH